jgi:hypothetical protein
VRKYDNEIGRFTSIDPLWEKYYSWTPYHYCSNNPVMGSDPGGMLLQMAGTLDEVKKFANGLCLASGSEIEYTMNKQDDGSYNVDVTGFKSVDDRFTKEQGYLNKIIISKDMFELKVDKQADLLGGGSYDEINNTATLSPSALNGEITYQNMREREPQGIGEKIMSVIGMSFHSYTTEKFDAAFYVAHELLGHAYLDATNQKQNEYFPRGVEAGVEVKRGNLPRNWYGK